MSIDPQALREPVHLLLTFGGFAIAVILLSALPERDQARLLLKIISPFNRLGKIIRKVVA